MNEILREAVQFFTRESRVMDGMAVSCGAGSRTETAWDGREIGEHTLYDLASVTKIFTAACLMRLWELKELEPSRRVTFYCPEFRYLSAVTVEQLMAFQVELRTPERIDAWLNTAQKAGLSGQSGSQGRSIYAAQPMAWEIPEAWSKPGWDDRERAERSLMEVRSVGAPGRRAYSDIPAMVLKYVIQAVSGLPFYECVRKLVLEPADMRETFARVPEVRRKDCLLYGPEYRIEGERYICRQDPVRGVPHDPKAAVLQGESEDLCGHAGMFSTLGDMTKLAQAILACRILGEESLRLLAVNRTGRELPDGTHTQYLGYQCYLKHPNQYFSEIPASMSPAAFGIGGFTGNHFSVDPALERFTIILGNRVRDRLTVLIPPAGKQLTDYGLRADGLGEFRWTDGTVHASSARYVHQKDAHLHAAVDRVFGEEM